MFWHSGEGSRHRILLNCHPKIKFKKKKVLVREAQITAVDLWPAARSLAQAEGEELLSSREVPRCHHLPNTSGKLRARLARVLIPIDMVVYPPSATLEEASVGYSTVSSREWGHPGLHILPPVLTLQNNSKVPNILLPLLPPFLPRSKPH